MSRVTFITGNEHKARILEDYLEFPVLHKKVELDELQSLDLREIVEHKIRQAFKLLKSPVLVEDVGLTIHGMGKLPGPFIKWFEKELGLEKICRLVDSFEDRSATAGVCFGYYDGKEIELFDGQVKGKIANHPKGRGFGWNPVFIPDGASKTYAEMDDNETLKFSLRTVTVFPQLKRFLESVDKK